MGRFRKCPNCPNREEGASIWTCKNCGCVHCKECDPDNGCCPKCGSDDVDIAGSIEAFSYASEEPDEGEYDECPNCGNNEPGASIWRCKNCGCEHCKECDPGNGCCPDCGSDDVRSVGYVRDDDDDE